MFQASACIIPGLVTIVSIVSIPFQSLHVKQDVAGQEMESESCLHRCTAALPASNVCGGTWIKSRGECELKSKGVKLFPPKNLRIPFMFLIEQMTLFYIIICKYDIKPSLA